MIPNSLIHDVEKLETLSNLPKVTQAEGRRTLTGVGCDSGWVLVKIGEPVVEQLESNLVTRCPRTQVYGPSCRLGISFSVKN